MDWNRVEGSWKQMKGKVKEQWGKLTDDDLDVIAGRQDQLEGKIQQVPTHEITQLAHKHRAKPLLSPEQVEEIISKSEPFFPQEIIADQNQVSLNIQFQNPTTEGNSLIAVNSAIRPYIAMVSGMGSGDKCDRSGHNRPSRN
jgi:uncharacterized protein YjbJ (UPF0337 family)